MKICICGGGSLGHVCAGVLGSNPDTEVNILTRHPECWSTEIQIDDINSKRYIGKINLVTSNPEHALNDCQLVLLCLPGFAIKSELETIKPYIDSNTIVGSIVSSTGFFFFAHEVLGNEAKLFGFQRVPYIARIVEYGKCANLLGYKSQVAIAAENVSDPEELRKTIEDLFLTPTLLLGSHYEVSLTNSNPILHTGRLYTMFSNWDGQPFDHNILFYKEWTNEASQMLIEMDSEFMTLLQHLPMNPKAIPSLLEYYESTDAESLTRKLSSITAFQNILSPMKQTEGGWMPDYESRYFSEDFPYGLRFIVDLCKQCNIEAPNLQKVFDWGISVCK